MIESHAVDKHSTVKRLGARTLSRRDFLRRAGLAGVTLGAAGGVSSLAAACGDTSQSEGPAPKGTKPSGRISLLFYGSAEALPYWNSLFDVFKQEYPDVELEAQGLPVSGWSEFSDTVATQIAGGKVPDLIQIATEGQRLFASKGLLEPLDAYIERDRAELQDFYDDVNANLLRWNRELTSPGGETFFLPGEFNTVVLWYNAELFQKAGLEEPTGDWTWDDLLTAAEELTGSGRFGMWVAPEYFASIMPWLTTNGASTMNETWTEVSVGSPAAIEAAEFMRSLVERGISPKPGGEFDEVTAAAQGKLAMYCAGRWPLPIVRDLGAVGKTKIVAFPQSKQNGSPAGWNAYPILRDSENKEAAWAFTKFMTTKKASEFLAQQGGVVPPRRSVATSNVFLKNSPEGIGEMYDALDYATPIPGPENSNVFQKQIEDTWEQILIGDVNPAQALEQLDQDLQGAMG